MGRDLHDEMATAAQHLAQTGRIAIESQQKLSQTLRLVFGPDALEAEERASSRSQRQQPKKPRREVDKGYRLRRAREVYYKALERGACYFLVFALCVTTTDCRYPGNALFPEQDERAAGIRCSLHRDTLALFKSWARFYRYDTSPAFVDFIDKLPEAPVEDEISVTEADITMRPENDPQPAMNDFEVVAKIIRDKGLERNPVIREAMSLLFPERAYRNWSLKFGLAPMVET